MKKVIQHPVGGLANQSGQSLLLVVLVIGGVMLSATTIAGFLTNVQLQQATDAANSAKAVFAADAGINCGIYNFQLQAAVACFSDIGNVDFKNGAFPEFFCYPGNSLDPDDRIPCDDENSKFVLSKGTSGTTKRAFLYTIE